MIHQVIFGSVWLGLLILGEGLNLDEGDGVELTDITDIESISAHIIVFENT